MIRRAALVVLALAFTACGGTYRLVEPRPTVVADVYRVEPQIAWSAAGEGRWETWTVDGSWLETLQFLKGLPDGEPLLRGRDEDKRPRFRKTMSPSEIMELVTDTLSANGVPQVTPHGLRPATFGGRPGFRFEMTYVLRSGLEKQALVAGAVVGDRLLLIFYSGVAQHYFGRYRDVAERIIESVQLK